jgi:uroporphyrinogen-III decarboxylase
VESCGVPWRGLTPEQVSAIDAQAAAHHPVVDALLAQYRELERIYGEKADILGTKSGAMTIHTPYTTAHQLCGEELFVTMMTDPGGAQRIFAKVWEIYEAVYARITSVTGARLTRIHMGDCAASLLSLRTYREVVLPVNVALASRFESAGYHSCGRSSHLLPAFRVLPKMDLIQLGAGTDLAESARLFPRVHLQPLVDPLLMLAGDPDAVRRSVEGILRETSPAPAVTLCAWSFDRDTPLENVAAMYDIVQRHK